MALIFTALLFPAVLGYAKIAFLLGFLLPILLLLMFSNGQKRIFNQHVFIWLFFIIGLNIFFVLWGMINGAGNEALIESLNIYVLYPSFYIFFIASLTQVLSVRTLTTLLLAISIATSYIVIAHVFRIGGVILPGYKLLYLLYPELQISIKPFEFAGNTGYLPRVMERLIFLGPFSVVLVAVRKSCGLGRFIVWTNLLLIVVAVIASERRSMLVVLLLAVMGVGALWVIVQPKRAVALGLTAIGGVAITVVLFGWNATGISVEDASLTRIVESYTESTLTIRRNQFAGLMAAAAESPLLGVGFGNSASGYLRDTEHPWRYELTYVALFFQTGILGVILYAIVFILLLLIAINSFRKSGDVILPYIFGLAGGLMSVATNPYLSYGTGQWILFLPLAAFNCVLLAKDRKVTVENKLPTRNVRTVD
ncbi:MAG: hypothetical protein PF483_11635 [Halothiobacillus sp.]|nr:hypothetical protein [Halothiobacillus sp.]